MLPSSPAADHPFFALPHQYQRDRLWSLFGPALLKTDWSPASLPWLNDTLMKEYWSALAALPEPDYSSTRLGLMFEQLWQQSLPLWCERLAANLQITNENRTLGEIDLLLESNGQQWHAELALKFYLASEQDWIGPNSRDRLYRKLEHTQKQQLQLTHQPAARQQLEKLNWHEPEAVALLRGCLFYPAADTDTPSSLPGDLNRDHWRGLWCYAHQAEALLAQGAWYLLAKDQWMSPVRTTTSASRDEILRHLRAHFRHLSYPVCAARLADGPYGLCEQERWMIMPDHWPQEGTHRYLSAKPQN